ncbi:MAG: hypothetical protein R2911_37425 [Caldilineaceae bacterium]
MELNPVPSISSFSPSSATGTLTGADFWVQINTAAALRRKRKPIGITRCAPALFQRRTWIRVRGSDLGLPWPRSQHPRTCPTRAERRLFQPRSFNITFPFLGTSELVAPASGSHRTDRRAELLCD